jgi:hypothetical protein
MKTKIPVLTKIEITHVLISVPVWYGEDDIPNNFPLREDDRWQAKVQIDTGKIEGWPQDYGPTSISNMKVTDGGTYKLLGPKGEVLATIDQDYVRNRLIPGEYGDYISLQIDEHGVITNWPKHPDVSKFFRAP